MRDLLPRPHEQPDDPTKPVSGNLRLHPTAGTRESTNANTKRLTLFPRPAYAPDPGPTETIWTPVKHDPGNLAATTLDEITPAVKYRPKVTPNRPDIINVGVTDTDPNPDD